MKISISINNIANAYKELRQDATTCTPTPHGEMCTLCSEKTPTHIFFRISMIRDLNKNCSQYT